MLRKIVNRLITISIRVNKHLCRRESLVEKQGFKYEQASELEGLLELAHGRRLGRRRKRRLSTTTL
jgi:hypothetical protein